MKILFVAYGGGHIAALTPVIKALKNQKDIEFSVFALTTAQTFLEKEKIDFFSYTNLPFPSTPHILNRGEELFSQLSEQKVNREESIHYLGWNMVELEETYGVEEAGNMYAKRGRHCFFPIQLMKKIIKTCGIDLVISTNSPRSEQAALTAASELGVPSICLVDGFAKYESEWISHPGFSSKVCVLSNSVKDNLVAMGRPAQDIVVTGNPAFDIFYSPLSKEKINQFKKENGIPEDKKVIVYASNPESEVHLYNGRKGDVLLPEKVLEKLIILLEKQEDYFLIFRPHPSQIFKNVFLSERMLFDHKFDLLTLLHASDVVVTLTSTVGLQAQIAGKPLICINSSVYAADIFYEDFGYVNRINCLAELNDSLSIALTRNDQNKIKKLNFLNATQNILEVINSFIKKHSIR
ncbi:MAG: CDP-glycerol glycerophosphotransferase family protein [Alphaproteobacteria bacterium]|nr:CDP-glycerol glycerophosphotransferase family protein [Alphaproteobacteria bacterium]